MMVVFVLEQFGCVINEYLNKFLINNKTDYEFFYSVNSNIKPSDEIKSVLTNEFFSGYIM